MKILGELEITVTAHGSVLRIWNGEEFFHYDSPEGIRVRNLIHRAFARAYDAVSPVPLFDIKP